MQKEKDNFTKLKLTLQFLLFSCCFLFSNQTLHILLRFILELDLGDRLTMHLVFFSSSFSKLAVLTY